MLSKFILSSLTNTPLRHLFSLLLDQQLSIFMLHRMNDPTNNVVGQSPKLLVDFLSQLQKMNFTFISLIDAIQMLKDDQPLPKKAIAFTMDDGFYDQADIAAPIFIQHDCPVTIFLISDFIDGKLWPWDDQLHYMLSQTKKLELAIDIGTCCEIFDLSSTTARHAAIINLRQRLKTISEDSFLDVFNQLSTLTEVSFPRPPPGYQSLSWERARQLEKHGVSFAPHSVTHRIFSQMTRERANREIVDSWSRLRAELNNPIPIFCFPTGRYNQDFGDREIQLARENGMIAAVSADPGYASKKYVKHSIDFYHLPRFPYGNNQNYMLQCALGIERAKDSVRKFIDIF